MKSTTPERTRRRHPHRGELLRLAQDVEDLTDLVYRAAAGVFSRDESELFAGRLVSMLLEGRRREHTRRTREGVARALEEGKRLGRPPALTPDEIKKARRMKIILGFTHRAIANHFGVGQSTVRRAIDPL